jgi:signal transduction histidine kinase
MPSPFPLRWALAAAAAACIFGAGVLAAIAPAHGLPALCGTALLLVGGGLLARWGGIGVVQRQMATAAEVERAAAAIGRRRARVITEMAHTLGASLDYSRVLEAAMDVGALGLKASTSRARLVSMVLLFDKSQKLYVATSRRLIARDAVVTVPGQKGILAEALTQSEPIIGGSGARDPELSYFASFQDARSVLVIPLRAGFQNYGLLVFGSTERGAFSEEHVELLAAISTQATIALQNAALYGDLREEKERIIVVEEDARKKLARDLHDGPTQSISAIAMRVNFIRSVVEQDPSRAAAELEKVEDLAHRTTREIRHMLFTLRPLVLENQGLAAALEQLRQKMWDTHGLALTLDIEPGVEELISAQAQGVLFYIIEEAVNNARKHAAARNHWVRLYHREQYVITEIQDDGVGFDPALTAVAYDQRGSLGMVNMRERAALVEGTLLIDSAIGAGTKITVLLPAAYPPPEPDSGDTARHAPAVPDTDDSQGAHPQNRADRP